MVAFDVSPGSVNFENLQEAFEILKELGSMIPWLVYVGIKF